MSGIKRVTVERIKLLDRFRDEWVATLMQTGPVDRQEAERNITEAYRGSMPSTARGLRFTWLDSPFQWVLASILLHFAPGGKLFLKNVAKNGSVWNLMEREARERASTKWRGSIRDDNFVQTCGTRFQNKVVRKISGPLLRLLGEMGRSVQSMIDARIDQHLERQIYDELEICVNMDFFPLRQGIISSACELDYALGVLRLDGLEESRPLIEAVKLCVRWMAICGDMIVCDRPVSLKTDAEGRLHCENDMAIKYRDGWGVYVWHGVWVSEMIVMKPERITVEEIDNEYNAEYRRVMVERYGHERYLIDRGAKPAHRDRYGVLYRREFGDAERVNDFETLTELI